MGRIRGFFCSFCLDRNPDHTTSNQSFNQDIDVSHLATPHVTSSILPAGRTPNSTAGCDSDSSENLYPQQVQVQNSTQNVIIQPQLHPDLQDSPYDDAARSSPLRQQENRIQPSPPTPARSPINPYEPQASQPSPEPQNNQSHREVNVQASQRQDLEPSSSNNFTQNTKLSYDIISVREPLAKILAERQLQQAQQRQILGDHEYIEVYGERGSSCFYEEIAGSTTSSAAYDQIGGPPNHNYQVLVNACAPNRANGVPYEERNSQGSHNIPSENEPNDGNDEENVYDVTSSSDPADQPSTDNKASCYKHTNSNSNSNNPTNSQTITQRGGIISQSIPVYSVINKGARRSNAIIRATVDNRRPPQPPPKNLFSYQPSTSAIQTYQEYSSSVKDSCTARGSTQVPSTSSFEAASFDGLEHHSKLPKPPPRFSKHPMYNGKNRPLPLPDKGELTTNEDESVKKSTRDRDEDTESLNNGYELLNPNFDDDQIDVGYEKIRESNRYSGGSISSQFSPLQVLDNGGYESVQPIYSSPSNALAEPNYEAIGSATASELAAAATAKLTAIEQTAIFKREQ